MNKEVLNPIILINGGDVAPGKYLLERELYVDKDGNLYYGKAKENDDQSIQPSSESPKKVNAYRADFIKSYVTDGVGNFVIDSKSGKGQFGTLYFGSDHRGFKGVNPTTVGIENTGLEDVAIINGSITNRDAAGSVIFNLKKITNTSNQKEESDMLVDTTRVTKVVLRGGDAAVSYGTDLPDKGEEGQLFFMIAE